MYQPIIVTPALLASIPAKWHTITFECRHQTCVPLTQELAETLIKHPDFYAGELCGECSNLMQNQALADAEETFEKYEATMEGINATHNPENPFCACDMCYGLPVSKAVILQARMDELGITMGDVEDYLGVNS